MKIIYFISILIVSISLLFPIWYDAILEYLFWKFKTDFIIPICLTIPMIVINVLMFLYFFG